MPAFTPELLQLLGGLALCLFGWVCYWGGLHVLGALAGGAVGLSLGWVIVRAGEMGDFAFTVLAIGGALGAVAGVFLFRQLHYGVFLLSGAIVGLVIGLQSAVWLREAGMASGAMLTPAAAGGGVIGGAMLFLLLNRHIIILITAFVGALLTATAYPGYGDPALIFIAALAVALAVQTGVVRWLGLGRKSGDEAA